MTFDVSAENLGAFSSDHWLQNPLNVIQLWLKEKAFDETAAPVAGVAPAVAKRGPKRLRM